MHLITHAGFDACGDDRCSREVGREFASVAGAGRRAPLSTSFESFAIDWDGMVNLWSTVFEDQMKIKPPDHTFVMTTLPGILQSAADTLWLSELHMVFIHN